MSSILEAIDQVRLHAADLQARGLSLPGSEPFPDVTSQARRFVDPALGPGVFDFSGAKSLWEIRQEVIDPAELAR